MPQNRFASGKTAKTLSFVLFGAALLLIALVFYNYAQSGTLNYTNLVIALGVIVVALMPFIAQKKR